jgi:tRNA pseudouridine38-40 synthase
VRYRAVVAYDGTRYQGWQAQRSGPTVQQTIESALSTVLREPIRISAAGRVYLRDDLVTPSPAPGAGPR